MYMIVVIYMHSQQYAMHVCDAQHYSNHCVFHITALYLKSLYMFTQLTKMFAGLETALVYLSSKRCVHQLVLHMMHGAIYLYAGN